MNKAELIDSVSKNTRYSKAQVLKVLDSILDSIQKSLKKGQTVQLVGFGVWKRKKRKARTGRNPKTGASIKIPAKNIPSFSAGKAFKDMLN